MPSGPDKQANPVWYSIPHGHSLPPRNAIIGLDNETNKNVFGGWEMSRLTVMLSSQSVLSCVFFPSLRPQVAPGAALLMRTLEDFIHLIGEAQKPFQSFLVVTNNLSKCQVLSSASSQGLKTYSFNLWISCPKKKLHSIEIHNTAFRVFGTPHLSNPYPLFSCVSPNFCCCSEFQVIYISCLSSDNHPTRAGVSSFQWYQLPHEGPEGDEGLGQNGRGQALHP